MSPRLAQDFAPGALSDLIGHVYDAALDPELWPEVLRRCCEFVPASAANFFSHDAISKTMHPFHAM